MKKNYLPIATATALFLFSTFAAAEKNQEMYQHGETQHQQNCVKCHDSSVYTREDRFVKSLEALNKQVKRCKDNLGVAWFDEDTDAVAHFLNEKYYKF